MSKYSVKKIKPFINLDVFMYIFGMFIFYQICLKCSCLTNETFFFLLKNLKHVALYVLKDLKHVTLCVFKVS